MLKIAGRLGDGSVSRQLARLARAPRPVLLRWLSAVGLTIIFLGYVTGLWESTYDSMQSRKVVVSKNLEALSLSRFDHLVRHGKIRYEQTKPEFYTDDGFEFEFRIATIFKEKPVLSADAPSRSKAGGPFVNPDHEEVIAELGHSHRLLANKYSIYRPMLVIPTKKYRRQTEDLDLSDMEAAWSVLRAFSTPSMVVYNCGVNAGSSQGHKHLQLFPQPAHFLWPSKATSPTDVATSLEGVPFKHFVLRIPKDSNAEDVQRIYQRLLQLSRKALLAAKSTSKDYNVIMTTYWMAVIPRRTAGPGGPYGANAAGMLGMVTLRDHHERDWWAELGYTKYLKELGIPFDPPKPKKDPKSKSAGSWWKPHADPS